jgi:hypothetical protein
MPSMLHESLLLLFRNRPTLAAEVLRDTLGVELPAFTEATIESADLTVVVPRERRADQVIVLREQGVPRLAIVVEAQLSPDDDKAYTWPDYVVGARSRYRCPACLLVVTTDSTIATRSAEPIDLGPGGSVLRPFVLGPSAVPVITEPDKARAMPELAVLSALAHGRSEAGLRVGMAALMATVGLDEEQAMLYEDVVLCCLSKAARRALEEMMASGNYEIQSEFLRKYVAQGEAKGKAEGVLEVLEARGLVIPNDVRERIVNSTDLAALGRWIRRAAVVSSAREIFDP